MSLVDWTTLLPARARVTFSSLRIPDQRDSLDDDIAEIMIDDWCIDVEWVDSENRYYVTLFMDEFENHRTRIGCRTPHDVVEAVRKLARDIDNVAQSGSAAVTITSTVSYDPAADSSLSLVSNA